MARVSCEITPRAWMESATCCGMELARSAVWNHHEVMYGINPKENARWHVMPYAYGNSILTCGEITYQSFGLDKKILGTSPRNFFVKRLRKRYFCRSLIRFRTLENIMLFDHREKSYISTSSLFTITYYLPKNDKRF